MQPMSLEEGTIEVAFEDDQTRQEVFLYKGQITMVPYFPEPQCRWLLLGTPIKFCATTACLVTFPNCLEARERLQTITAMKMYSGKSIEELRFEDYKVRKPLSSEKAVHGSPTLGSIIPSELLPSSFFPVVSSRPMPYALGADTGVIRVSFPQRKAESPVAMSIDCSPDESEAPSSSNSYSFIPNFNFASESDPSGVFSPSQPQAGDKKPLSALSASEGQQLKGALLESIASCIQIQNSLYRLVLVKLQAFIRGQADTDSEYGGASSVCKDSRMGGTGDTQTTGLGALLNDLKEPLNSLMRCADIQRSLYQRLVTVSLIISEETEQSVTERGEVQDNLTTVQSELEGIAFENKLECGYARNPFTSIQYKASTSKDILRQISGKDTQLPHGQGSLKTVKGKLLYCGQWRKGKRHGKGEGLIFSFNSNLSTPNYSTKEHGFYTGGWKLNMRHGHGQMTFFSGAAYEGQWQFDRMTGYGTLKLPDGTIQEGTWKEGSLQGCALFTWPHGVTEYREYDAIRGQLSSCKIGKQAAEKLSQISSIRSQLLKLREQLSELKEERSSLAEQLNTQKREQAEAKRELMSNFARLKANFMAQRKKDCQQQRDEYEQKLKEAAKAESESAERIRELEKQLEESSNAQLCQICFEHPRDCIIMPCTHLLYCRACVAQHKRSGGNRCPTCRGPISGEILCNINHSS